MELPKDAMMLRIFIGEGDEFKGAPLYPGPASRLSEFRLSSIKDVAIYHVGNGVCPPLNSGNRSD
jgi:PII-like signaling protein